MPSLISDSALTSSPLPHSLHPRERHGVALLAANVTLALGAILWSSGCGGAPSKPPAGSEESPLDLKVEMDDGAPSTPALDEKPAADSKSVDGATKSEP